MPYRSLSDDAIIKQASQLSIRIKERFPDRGLARVCEELLMVAKEARQNAASIAAPNIPLRLGIGLLIVTMFAGLAAALAGINVQMGLEEGISLVEFVELVEAGINDLVLLGAGIFFIVTFENRIKQRRTLHALHELRSLAHVVDMHQLTKDPERVFHHGPDTQSSPREDWLGPFELTRYLDYCSEMLSLIGKVAALYVQDYDDGVAVAAVNEIEDLTTSLSSKIWQKIMIIQTVEAEEELIRATREMRQQLPPAPPPTDGETPVSVDGQEPE